MLILASASPRRQELLRSANILFTAKPTDIPEDARPGEAARDCAERLAREKAMAIAHLYPDAFVLGADTIVVVDGEMLGKPRDPADAARMLRLLSGRSHQVITGVCLAEPYSGNALQQMRTASETTLVTFEPLTEEDIQYYITTREPMDKAGAYAIQGMASRWVSRIEGDYSNVVGLPVPLVYRLLREHGFTFGI
jgi:septum formation protein